MCHAFCVMWVAAAAAAAPGKEKVPVMLQPFDLHDVRLLAGPCLAAQEANRQYLHSLENDRSNRMTASSNGTQSPSVLRLSEALYRYLCTR